MISSIHTLLVIAYASTVVLAAASPRVVQISCRNVSDHTGNWQAALIDFRARQAPMYITRLGSTVIAGDLLSDFSLPDGPRSTGRLPSIGLDKDVYQYMDLSANISSDYHQFETITTPLELANKWTREVWNGQNYTVKVGHVNFERLNDTSPSIVDRFANAGYIDSSSYSLSMGNSQFGPSGSITLGGYEQNRVLGDVAVFAHEPNFGFPIIYLVDMTLGVELGGSPFASDLNISKDNPKSVWVSANKSDTTGGGAYNSMNAQVEGAVPSLFLPSQNCKAIADHLPVSWNATFGYYIWDTSSERYQQLTTSPAYLGLVFDDASDKKVTVKIPFRLLNPTFTPFTNQSFVYFPCQPSTARNAILGRVFLQSAFYATNFASNLTYLGQGPGPVIGQSILRAFPTDDTSPLVSGSKTLAYTWSNFWTPLPEPPKRQTDNSTSDSGSKGLSAGAIAGIVIGVVVAITFVGALAWFLGRRATIMEVENMIQEADSAAVEAKKTEVGAEDAVRHELPGPEAVQEIAGDQLAELE